MEEEKAEETEKKKEKVLDLASLGPELEHLKVLESLEKRGLLDNPPQTTQVVESRHSCGVCGRPVAPCMLQVYRGKNHCNECLKKAERER